MLTSRSGKFEGCVKPLCHHCRADKNSIVCFAYKVVVYGWDKLDGVLFHMEISDLKREYEDWRSRENQLPRVEGHPG
jgi:hypothetical protein